MKWDGGSRIHRRRDYPQDYLFPLRDDRFTDKWFIVDYVRQYEPNAWGLYDMHGNVFEWCNDNDLLDTTGLQWGYDTTDTIDPAGPGPHPGNMKMLRGGAADGTSRLNRSFDRISLPYDITIPPNGFRTCKTEGE